jgi:alanine or glycine:cation symporter, AGCS family
MQRVLPLLFALFLAFLPLSTAHAAEGEADDGVGAALDAAFANWVVNPLATIMFWDLMFWDNTLADGEGIGSTVEGGVVTAYEGGSYTVQPQSTVALSTAVASPAQPVTKQMGTLEVAITGGPDGLKGQIQGRTLDPVAEGIGVTADGGPDGQRLADWIGPAFELGALGGEQDSLWVVKGLAPFPAVVQVKDGIWEVASVGVALADDALPVQVGSRVQSGDVVGSVLSIDGDQATIGGEATTTLAGPLPNPKGNSAPIVVVWLVIGAVFFTLRMNFINLRGFVHAIVVTTGKYDNPEETGEVTHFQALSAALSATVGLGNIAGVAVAVAIGGPGAIFWMILAGFLGMSSKFVECTLGQMYRIKDSKGQIRGGPMEYLSTGLAELGQAKLGRVLAVVFAVMCIGGSFGGGNMFQANQSGAAVRQLVPILDQYPVAYGLILAICVGLVVMGGIRSIGKAASAIVPLMCGVYVAAALFILVTNAAAVPDAFSTIIGEAFSPEAGRGGLVGVLIQGFKRAAFSNEAGIGSASIAHSAAATEEPVREGIVALLEPFIDTIIVCTMTGLVVVITGAYANPAAGQGVEMTAWAFSQTMGWFPILLSFAVVMFAFSTMISWSYYGERCWTYLFGEGTSRIYQVIFLGCVVLGSTISLDSVITFSDLMILGMAFPNILGLFLLSSKVKGALDDYWSRYKTGEFNEDQAAA